MHTSSQNTGMNCEGECNTLHLCRRNKICGIVNEKIELKRCNKYISVFILMQCQSRNRWQE